MNQTVNQEVLRPLREKLENHPVYRAVSDIEKLRCFMEHHVHSVWDFMSLLKFLQHQIAPARYPWIPVGDPTVRRFINQLVLEEESDEALPDEAGNMKYASHFELYLAGMEEVGANSQRPGQFVELVRTRGIESALKSEFVPAPCRQFSQVTFDFIQTGKPHVVAAAFAFGRENIIPMMFRSLLKEMHIEKQQAPIFHLYLERHIYLDSDFHGPWSLRLLGELCQGDAVKMKDAEGAAILAMEARIAFWDGVLTRLKSL